MDIMETLEALKIHQKIRKCDIDGAITTLEKALQKEPIDRFKILLRRYYALLTNSFMISTTKRIWRPFTWR